RDQKVELACVVTAISRQISRKNGAEWGKLTVEDFYGTASVLAFGDVWEQYHDLLLQDAPVLLRGSVSGRDRDEADPPIFLDSAVPLGQLRTGGALAVELLLTQGAAEEAVTRATDILRASPGSSPVYVTMVHGARAARGSNGVAANGGNGSHDANGSNGGNGGSASLERVRSRAPSMRVMPGETLLRHLRALFGSALRRLVRC